MFSDKYVIQSGGTQIKVANLAEALGALNDYRHLKLDLSSVSLTRIDQNGSHPVPLVELGVAIPGPQDTALLGLLEPYIRAASEKGVLQPWQMSRIQWNGFNAIGRLAYGLIPGLPNPQPSSYPPIAATTWLHHKMMSIFEFGHNGPAYREDEDTNGRHEVHVCYALAAGKPVEQAVIDDMLSALSGFDLDIARPLAERPFLRGKLTVEQLSALLAVYEKAEKKLVTEETVDALFGVANTWSLTPTLIEMDDALFMTGWISPLAPLQPQASAPQEPFINANAAALFDLLQKSKWKKSVDRLELHAAEKTLSRREIQRRMSFITNHPQFDRSDWSNKVVATLDSRNIRALLALFDTPDDSNTVSKRFAREAYGLDVLNLKSAARGSAIFRYCGMDSDAEAKWRATEKEIIAATHAAATAKETRDLAISAALGSPVKETDGSISNWKDVIDRKIASGFTEMFAQAKGAVRKHFLMNPETRAGIPVQRKNGSLMYAQLAVAEYAAARPSAELSKEAGLSPASDETEEFPLERERESQRG